MTITAPGIYDGMSNAEYHADPVPAGSLSVSGAKLLLPPNCPAIYKHRRDNPQHKDVFDFGTAAHSLVLEGHLRDVVVVDADDWRSKTAQEKRKEARENGQTAILRDDEAKVRAMADAIKAHPIARLLLRPENGKPEQSAFWVDDQTGVWRRARYDWLPDFTPGRRPVVTDYKTAASANPRKFAKAAGDLNYHMQAAWYIDGLRALGVDDDPAFLFLVQEKEAPFLVSVVELDWAAIDEGRRRNTHALEVYAECAATNTWPGYTDTDVELVSLPAYYTNGSAA